MGHAYGVDISMFKAQKNRVRIKPEISLRSKIMDGTSINKSNTGRGNISTVNRLKSINNTSNTTAKIRMNPQELMTSRVIEDIGSKIKNIDNPEELLQQIPRLKAQIAATRQNMDMILDQLIERHCPEDDKEAARAKCGDADQVFAFIHEKLQAQNAKETNPQKIKDNQRNIASLRIEITEYNESKRQLETGINSVLTITRDKSEQIVQDPNVSAEQKAEIKAAYKDLMKTVNDMYKHFNMDTSKIKSLNEPLSEVKAEDSNSPEKVIKSAEEKTREANEVKKELNEMRAKLREIVSEAIKCRTFIDEAKRSANEAIQDEKDNAKQMMIQDIKKKEDKLIDAKKTLQSLAKKRDGIKLAMKEKTQNMLNISFELNQIMDKVASSDFVSQFSEQLPEVLEQVDKMCFTKQGEVDNVYDYA